MIHRNPDISVERWVEILEDPGTTTPEALKLFQALYARPDHRGAASELGAALGKGGGAQARGAAMNRVVVSFGERLGRHHFLEYWEPTRTGRKRKYWPLPFYSGPRPPEGGWGEEAPLEKPTSEKGLFIWILRPELAEAMKRLRLTGEAEALKAILGEARG